MFGLPSWAWRLMLRHFLGIKSRPAVKWMNIFAFCGLVVGVFSWTAVISIMNGLQGDIRKRNLDEKAHLLWEATPRSDVKAMHAELESLLGSQLKRVDFLLQTEGLLEIPNDTQKGRVSGSGVILQGIENYGPHIVAGSELLSLLSLEVNQKIRLHNVWKMESAPLDVSIDKSFSSGVYDVDRSTLRIDKAKLSSWMGLPQDSVNRVEIRLVDPYLAADMEEKIQQKLGLEFKTWQQTDQALWYSLKVEKLIMAMAVFFIVLIAIFAVHLALSVRVADKTREIALLRALGTPDIFLTKLYLFEGLILGTSGAVMGLLLSYGFCILISSYASFPAIYYSTAIPVDWNWPLNILLTLCAVILAGLASWWPSQKVKTIEIQEALRS